MTPFRAMRLALLLLVVVTTSTATLSAQSPARAADRAAVERAALDYLEGFYEGDSTKLARSVAATVFKYGYAARDGGPYAGMQMPYDQFFSFARGVQAGRNKPPANAPKDVVIFEVLDQVASAKVVAWWGIDYLLLGKQNGKWMITHVTWQTPPPKE